MGLRINADIETSSGPTNAVYIRVDGVKWSKITNEISFTTSTWLSKEESDAFNKIYVDDEQINAVGILAPIMSFYKDADSLGEDISIPNFFKFVPTYKGTVETPIYEVKEVTEEIPYVSFDSEGDEITLYRTKIKQEKVKALMNWVCEKCKNVHMKLALLNIFLLRPHQLLANLVL